MNELTNERLIQPFGYSEMYEWSIIPQISQTKLGSFVQFSKHYPDKIELYHDEDGILAGVSTICSVLESDDPDNWPLTYLSDPVGDIYLRKETLAVGIKQYDQNNELSYIQTKPWEHYVKVKSKEFDDSKKYVKRSNRPEWVRVNLLGKTIVRDDGSCIPGKYCSPYVGDDMNMVGKAVLSDSEYASKRYRFYVLNRISENTILISNIHTL